MLSGNDYMMLEKSSKMLSKAKKLIPGASQTFSKGPSQFVQGVAPNFLHRGEGCHVYDLDENEFIDPTMALGSVILGYDYPAVKEAIIKQLQKGSIFSLPSPLEVELAEILVDVIPCAEMVRYGKNGSDVTSAAVRVARAYTGREKIACCGYHGWQDWYIGTTVRDWGVPQCVKNLTYTFDYNDIESLRKIFEENDGEVAAVIMEPLSTTEPKGNFLEKIKKLTHENGAILIFDEVVTGFRIALGGAQEYYKVTPDLACFGKGMANGMPLSAIVGKAEIMERFEEVFFSFTFGGETLSIASAISTINEIREKNILEYIWDKGKLLKDALDELILKHDLGDYLSVRGLPPRFVMLFETESGEPDLELKSLFQQECLKRRILFTSAFNTCFSHTDKDIHFSLQVYDEVLALCKEAIDDGNIKEKIDGQVVLPVMRKI